METAFFFLEWGDFWLHRWGQALTLDQQAWHSGVLCWPVKFLGTKLAHPCLNGSCFVHWCAVVLEQEGAIHKAVPTNLGAWNYSKCLVCWSIKSSFQPSPTTENPSHTIIPPTAFTLGALQAGTHTSPGKRQTQTCPPEDTSPLFPAPASKGRMQLLGCGNPFLQPLYVLELILSQHQVQRTGPAVQQRLPSPPMVSDWRQDE